MSTYSPDADFWVDVCRTMTTFLERLPETLGVEVDIDVIATQQSENFRYVDMVAMLSAKTIWGDISRAEATRGTAMDLLQQGYARIKKDGEMMSHVRQTLLSTKEVLIVKVTSSAITNTYQAELMSPEQESLRLSLLQEALSVIRFVKTSGGPFYASLRLTMWEILAKEKFIQAYFWGDVDCEGFKGVWRILSDMDMTNTASLLGMQDSAEEFFWRAGLVPLG